jgi:hypothetical protein
VSYRAAAELARALIYPACSLVRHLLTRAYGRSSCETSLGTSQTVAARGWLVLMSSPVRPRASHSSRLGTVTARATYGSASDGAHVSAGRSASGTTNSPVVPTFLTPTESEPRL